MTKKFYYLTLDTETAGTQDEPIVYDLGGCVHDRHGNIVERFSFVITEVFSDKNLMATAYYCDKIPMYLKGMNKEWDPVHWYEARKYIFNLLDKYNIKYVCAYNARFDSKALNNTMKYITHGKYKYYFHYNQVVWLDTMKAVNQVIATQKKYGKYCVNNGYMTNHKTPRPQVKAEVVYRYLIDDNSFIESHTALSDSEIEAFILSECFRKHKKMDIRLYKNEC